MNWIVSLLHSSRVVSFKIRAITWGSNVDRIEAVWLFQHVAFQVLVYTSPGVLNDALMLNIATAMTFTQTHVISA